MVVLVVFLVQNPNYGPENATFGVSKITFMDFISNETVQSFENHSGFVEYIRLFRNTLLPLSTWTYRFFGIYDSFKEFYQLVSLHKE